MLYVRDFPEVSVLGDDGQVVAAGREGKLVDGHAPSTAAALAGASPAPHRPLVEGVAGGLGLAGEYGVALALLEQLVDRGLGSAHQLVVVDVHVAGGVRHQKVIPR